jgi:hypothetical protein
MFYSNMRRLLQGLTIGGLVLLQCTSTTAFASPTVILKMVMLHPSQGMHLSKNMGRRGSGVKALQLSSTAIAAGGEQESGFFGKVCKYV